MGSEHYCLRWNNHQSNLLGVFSQLLQDESLVDVTLSCSEGAPIRAHKVVLSACSSYFQSLFLDHPERHPIVILKDVRFAELQTLVEFMYKGEVNVQYCQLSALLKTAESLKVKGLAEMTNQNTALREPEREPDRLRTQPSKSSCESPVDAALAGPASATSSVSTPSSSCSTGTTVAHVAGESSPTAVTTSVSSKTAPPSASSSSGAHKREASERCSSTPPKRTLTATAKTHERIGSPLPLDLYQRRSEVEETSTRAAETSGGEGTTSNNTNQPNHSPTLATGGAGGAISGTNSKLSHHDNTDESESLAYPKRPTSASDAELRIEKAEDADDYDEDMDLDDEDVEGDDNSSSNEMGLNMKISGCGVVSIMGHTSLPTVVSSPLHTGGGGVGDIESARSTPAISCNLPSDLTQRPASRSSRDGAASTARTPTERPSSSGLCPSMVAASAGMSPSSSCLATAGNIESETLASTSGLGPVQSVPLSLKKEIECSEDDNSNSRHMQPRSASAGGGLGSELDYRASHESLLRSLSMVGSSSSSPFSARCPTPFAFPFSPLGLSLFDIDPSRILSMLHHQTWLAEETLRNRGLLGNPKELTHRVGPLHELFGKDYYANNLHTATSDLLSGAISATATATATATSTAAAASAAAAAAAPSPSSKSSYAAQLSPHSQQQYKQQPFGLRYPSPAALFQHHHHHQHQHQQHQTSAHRLKPTRPHTPSQNPAAASSTQVTLSRTETLLERKSEASSLHREDDDAVIELSSNDETPMTTSRAPSTVSANLLYKESLEQLLQQRRHSGGDNLRSYSQLLLSNTPSCITDTSSCKEKSSSSSTSSTPPPTSALLAQHQHLSQMLKSPSDTSSLFSEPIEEETRCVVCNAHFPNVWLLEQHAALQHPHIGPGEEKPFICEQCGQSYRYRSAYAKHKEQNHRARLPADKLFTCDVCGMQFRYLKSFKKHRLNHALERLHGKKVTGGKYGTPLPTAHLEQDVVTSSQEALLVEESGEDLRINVKRERIDDDEHERARTRSREGDQDSTIDSAGIALLYNDNNSTASASTNSAAAEPTISSSDVIHSTNQRPRLLNTTHMETDPSYQHQQHSAHHHHHHLQQPQTLSTHLHAAAAAAAAAAAVSPSGVPTLQSATHAATAMNSLNSLNSITSLINAERIPSEQFLGLNPQEASILNFLRVDAAERQRDKRPPTSRFACPFCGKCVRSKENLKLHVRKHTGERPFVCLFCGRAFGGKSDLTRHLRIHTGERPYHCESCGKCFARADYLSKHLTTHIHNAPR